MNDMLGQNVEIENDIDSMAKVETSSRKLKFHDITYEKVNGAFKKRLAERDIKKEIKEEVNDYAVDKKQEHLDKVSVLMSQYKFIKAGVKESPEFVARRAIRLNEQMIYNAKLNSEIIDDMLEKENVDNISTMAQSDEEQLVNTINQITGQKEADVVVEPEPEVPAIDAVEVAPVTSDFASASVDEEPVVNTEEKPAVDLKFDEKDFAPLFDNNEKEPEKVVEPAAPENGILPMTDEEIEASRELLKKTEPREDGHRFSFEDIFANVSTAQPEEEPKEMETENKVVNDEEAFLEVDKLLQQADDLRSRGNKANEEREKAEQRRKAAEDRRMQAADDEAMKKAALAEAIEKYKAFVAELKADETETLQHIEEANAAADKEEEETRAAEERSAYTQKVIDSLLSSMDNKPRKR